MRRIDDEEKEWLDYHKRNCGCSDSEFCSRPFLDTTEKEVIDAYNAERAKRISEELNNGKHKLRRPSKKIIDYMRDQ